MPSISGTIADVNGGSPDFGAPLGLAFRQSKLYAVNVAKSNMLRFSFDAAGNALPATHLVVPASWSQRYAAISPWGELFLSTLSVADGPNIIRGLFDVAGEHVYNGVMTGPEMSVPMGMAFSPIDNDLYLVNAGNNSISRYGFPADPTGPATLKATYSGIGLVTPIDAAFSSWGELFVTNSTGGISRFNLDGSGDLVPNGSFASGIKFEGLATIDPPLKSYARSVLDYGPTGYWRLNETGGSIALDAACAPGPPQSGAQNGTPVNAVPLLGTSPGVLGASGDDNTAANFGGTGRVEIPAGEPGNTVFDFTTADGYTLEAWIKSSATSGSLQPILSKYVPGGYMMALLNTGSGEWYLHTLIHDGTKYAVKYYEGMDLADDEWHHVVATHAAGGDDPNSLTLFIDGQKMTATTTAGNGPVGDITNNAPLMISGFSNFNGVIDEAAIYGYVLRDDIIQFHYNIGVGIPEPSTLVLLALGGLSLVLLARRRAVCE